MPGTTRKTLDIGDLTIGAAPISAAPPTPSCVRKVCAVLDALPLGEARDTRAAVSNEAGISCDSMSCHWTHPEIRARRCRHPHNAGRWLYFSRATAEAMGVGK
jgi:hypothetical protein